MKATGTYGWDGEEFLIKTRTVFLYGEINAAAAYEVGCRLKYLDFIDPHEPITLEINSPGGEVSSGLAIIDTMNCIGAPVRVVVCGMAASMAALIVASGSKGMRGALPNSNIMIHQPLGGTQGQTTDMQIQVERMLKIKQRLNEILASNTGKPLETIKLDTERDNFMTAEEAQAYGLVDKVIYKRQ